MTAYFTVPVTPDTPEWMEERRKSVGASEVAAIMGLSKWATPLDIYKAKSGVDRTFDEILGFVGHASEPIMHEWVERFSGVGVILSPGFMARSSDVPFLHASFDRISHNPFTTWQLKTTSAYASHHWDEGIPTEYRVQVQAEMYVAGTQRAAVVVWIGGREFRLFWEARDERFIREQMIPSLHTFWDGVQSGVPPEPATMAEIAEVFPSEERDLEASDTVLEALDQYAVLSSDIKAMEGEREALKVAIGNYFGTADTLTHKGRKVATFKSQKGRAGFDARAFAADHPQLHAEYVRIGQPFKVLRTVKTKEK